MTSVAARASRSLADRIQSKPAAPAHSVGSRVEGEHVPHYTGRRWRVSQKPFQRGSGHDLEGRALLRISRITLLEQSEADPDRFGSLFSFPTSQSTSGAELFE